jgi:type IV secretory pathway VirB10-like protein
MTLRPAPPVATRLNRVALGLIGGLVIITALVGVHYIAMSGGPVGVAGVDSIAATSVPQRPSFPYAPTHPDSAPVRRATVRVISGHSDRVLSHQLHSDLHSDLRGHLIVVVDSVASPYTLSAGTVLSVMLITQINSDLPGTVVAQFDRDAYDSRTGRTVLIPKGARLIGRYDSHLSVGQRRLFVTWGRLVFPDGRELALPDLAAVDEHGAAGLSDETDNHLGRVFGTALLLSAVGAGAQLSQPTSGNALTTPSAGQVAAGAFGQQMSGTSLDVLRRNADVPPTITARAGLPFDLVLARDLVLSAPYVDSRRP